MADVNLLLVYDLRARALRRIERFEDGAAAMTRYFEVEKEHFQDPTVEVALVAADSEETIRCTHGSYFPGEVDLDAMLA